MLVMMILLTPIYSTQNEREECFFWTMLLYTHPIRNYQTLCTVFKKCNSTIVQVFFIFLQISGGMCSEKLKVSY
jgi:hypothetical protein